MSWKKYFTPVEGDNGASSPLTMTGQQPGPARSNYSSYLPDVYTGAPNRTERYGQYNVMDMDSEVNAALDILAEFCTQQNPVNKTAFNLDFKRAQLIVKLKYLNNIYNSGANQTTLILECFELLEMFLNTEMRFS